MNFQLASEIVRGIWLVGEDSKPTLLSMAANILSGKMAFEKQTAIPFASYYDEDDQDSKSSVGNSPKILVINLQGVMVKYDQPCGVYGMESIAKTIDSARTDDNIIGAMVVGDTPGGSVAGTQTLADSIWNFRKEKPFLGLVNGGVASAGYWAFSQCDEIYLTNSLDSVGSIGVMATLISLLKAMEMQGIEEIKMYSSLSPDKNSIYDRIFSSDQPTREKAIKEFDATVLTPIAKQFHAEVLRGRPGIDKSTLTGKVYMSAEAISLGMADGIKSFKECLDRVVELSSKSRKSNSRNTNKQLNSNAMDKHERLAAAVGGAFELDAEGFASFKEEALDGIENALQALEDAMATAQTALDAATARIQELEEAATAASATHQDAISGKDTEIAGLKEQVANLKGKTPAKSVTPSSKTEVTSTTDSDDLGALDKELQGMDESERISYIQSRLKDGSNS